MNQFVPVFKRLLWIIIPAWLAWFAIALGTTRNLPAAGQLGDLFGGINALFSGIALAGVIAAVVLQTEQLKLQKEELILQRKELELTRAELEKTADANQKSAEALRQQIETQALAAKLSAIVSLLSAVEGQQAYSGSAKEVLLSMKAKRYRAQMEAVLKRMGLSDDDQNSGEN